jgi:hypothetical protein
MGTRHILSGVRIVLTSSVKFVQESVGLHGYVQTAFAPNLVQSRMELIWKK